MNSDTDTLAGGFPHSEMSGSKPARSSPDLIATCYVLHRLSVPRHPPDALMTLDRRLLQRHAQGQRRSPVPTAWNRRPFRPATPLPFAPKSETNAVRSQSRDQTLYRNHRCFFGPARASNDTRRKHAACPRCLRCFRTNLGHKPSSPCPTSRPGPKARTTPSRPKGRSGANPIKIAIFGACSSAPTR